MKIINGIRKIAEQIVAVDGYVAIGGKLVKMSTIACMPYKKACKQMEHELLKFKVAGREFKQPRIDPTVVSEKCIISRDNSERDCVVTYYPTLYSGIYLVKEYNILTKQSIYNIEECSKDGSRSHLNC